MGVTCSVCCIRVRLQSPEEVLITETFIYLPHFCLSQFHSMKWIYFYRMFPLISRAIDNSRTGLDTSKNQCSAPAVTALKNYWRYHVYNLFRLKNSSNVFAFIIIIIGCRTGNIIHDQLKLRPYFLPWVSKNRRYRILKGIDRLSDFIFIIEPRSLKICRRI